MASTFPSISKKQTREIIPYLSCCYFLFLMPCYAYFDAGDTLSQGDRLYDSKYLNSANKIFRLQFFSPGASKSSYLGIFYNKPFKMRNFLAADANPVWIANRDNPVRGILVMLMIDPTDGLLKISHDEGNITVSNSTPSAKNTSATILDNGNLVLRMLNRDGSINRTLWQSFDYPTDTLLPGMKIGINSKTGHKWSLSSWTSSTEPASGSFTLGGDTNGLRQLMLWWQGDVYWTSGTWERGSFNNTQLFGEDFNFAFVSNENENYLTYSGQDSFSLQQVSMDSNGLIHFDAVSAAFFVSFCSVAENLDPGCLHVMETLPKCRKTDLQFRKKQGLFVGSGYTYDQKQNLSLFDCKAKCRQSCSCTAFALTKNGTRCEIFNKVTTFSPTPSEHYGDVLYFLDTRRARWWVRDVGAVAGTLILLSIYCYIIWKGKVKREKELLLQELTDGNVPPGQYSGVIDKIGKKMKNQVHLFSFESLEMATDNFCTENKLGEGGFGSVYKGVLQSGQEIAIKRLSRSSGQGLLEFKNEILLIAKLQHDNLVKLLGCCIERHEKILVYEFMPNRSLDFYLFDSSRRGTINWTKRMNIIEGVAQGLLYLHKYSRLRVIHRDLKASNILLDQNMNPKISDFGMARIFGKQESEQTQEESSGHSKKHVGYMSPEYAMRGVFSMKSDVFSFGVLLPEIVSGKKNRGCYHSQRPLNLIGYAWELWVEGRAIELVDPTLDESNHRDDILRCINVGLLCVQDNANDRPSMTDVITMLTNESLQLPKPKKPAFFIDTRTHEADKEEELEKPCTNDLSISVMEGR